MPKIDVNLAELKKAVGGNLGLDELVALFPAGKAELDEGPDEHGVIKVELNDTNRPDLWSAAGVARQLRTYREGKVPEFPFFSTKEAPKPCGDRKVIVDASVRDIRPFMASFVARGKVVDNETLVSLIQTQEKICWNYGQKRKSISMGIYRADLIKFPVHYLAVDPDSVSFVPLGFESAMTLRQTLDAHPKGQEYGHILRNFKSYPIIRDAAGKILSFPPIINSNDLGAVKIGDSNLFIELCGNDLPSLLIATNIMACDFHDMGWTIEPVGIEYPNPTTLGKSLVTPMTFQESLEINVKEIRRLLGLELSLHQILDALKKMGNRVKINGDVLTIFPAEYRNDFLHPVDIIEDVMVGHGLDNFEPELPRSFSIGRLSPIELFSRKVKDLLVGLGYQEMIFNYLGSARDFIWKMQPDMENRLAELEQGQALDAVYGPGIHVQILNPMSENFEYVRSSVLPSLLNAESVSANAQYPHAVFEVGKVAVVDPLENYGSRTDTNAGFVLCHGEADFNVLHSDVRALLYFLGHENLQIAESSDSRFIPGRRAALIKGGRTVGVFGEVHPGILANWGITMPVAACEIAINFLLED